MLTVGCSALDLLRRRSHLSSVEQKKKKKIGVLTSVGTLSPSRGSRTKRLTSSDMSLDTQWMAVTFRATFFGPPGQLNNPSGA